MELLPERLLHAAGAGSVALGDRLGGGHGLRGLVEISAGGLMKQVAIRIHGDRLVHRFTCGLGVLRANRGVVGSRGEGYCTANDE